MNVFLSPERFNYGLNFVSSGFFFILSTEQLNPDHWIQRQTQKRLTKIRKIEKILNVVGYKWTTNQPTNHLSNDRKSHQMTRCSSHRIKKKKKWSLKLNIWTNCRLVSGSDRCRHSISLDFTELTQLSQQQTRLLPTDAAVSCILAVELCPAPTQFTTPSSTPLCFSLCYWPLNIPYTLSGWKDGWMDEIAFIKYPCPSIFYVGYKLLLNWLTDWFLGQKQQQIHIENNNWSWTIVMAQFSHSINSKCDK